MFVTIDIIKSFVNFGQFPLKLYLSRSFQTKLCIIVSSLDSGILWIHLDMFGGVQVVTCSHCGRENPEDEVLCMQCSMPLKSENGSTRLLDGAGNITNQPRWGTARLGDERKLLLHVRNHDEPVIVGVTDTLILGRYDTDTGDTPEVDLTDYEALDLGVSRRHAAILVEDEALKVMDLGSANATYLNGQRLIARQARILRDGDEIRLGRLVMRVNFA
ncbi:FHA domain-containing protein [candidate division KSB3 bacterium]|nr:FHA domain-containing protein [candidate division KSB3 bacterium]